MKRNRGANYISSEMYCTKCGRKGIYIPRKVGDGRGSGHLKKLFCIHCKQVINHCEIIDNSSKYTLEDFKEDFNLGRFVNGERVAIEDMLDCENENCNFNKNKKCWNCNDSQHCSGRELLSKDRKKIATKDECYYCNKEDVVFPSQSLKIPMCEDCIMKYVDDIKYRAFALKSIKDFKKKEGII